MELAIRRRLCRVVADQVVRALIARDLLHAGCDVVTVHDGAAVGVVGQHAQRIHRGRQVPRVGLNIDVLVDVELEDGQPPRIDGVDRDVVLVRRVVDVAQILIHVEVRRPRGAVLVDVVGARERIVRRRVAEPGHRRIGVAHLRRNDVRVALADEDQRLASFLQRSHVHDERLDRGHRDLVADLFDDFRRIVRVGFFVLVLRLVLVLAAEELLQAAHDCGVIARHADARGRLERIHHADHVRRPDIFFDERRELIADGHARTTSHVIVVEEHREQPHVVARRFGFLVVVGADFARRILDRVRDAAVQLDELEGFDLLRLAVFSDVEVGLLQIGKRVAGLVRDDHVHTDEIDARAEDRRLIRVRRRWLWRRRLLPTYSRDEQQRGGCGEERAHPSGHTPILAPNAGRETRGIARSSRPSPSRTARSHNRPRPGFPGSASARRRQRPTSPARRSAAFHDDRGGAR